MLNTFAGRIVPECYEYYRTADVRGLPYSQYLQTHRHQFDQCSTRYVLGVWWRFHWYVFFEFCILPLTSALLDGGSATYNASAIIAQSVSRVSTKVFPDNVM